MGKAIVEFIRHKPWNARNAKKGELTEVYLRTRASLGKLSGNMKQEFLNAGVHLHVMCKAGKLVHVQRGIYTLPKIEAKSETIVESPVTTNE